MDKQKRFSEFEFTKENLLQWAEEEVAKEPTIQLYDDRGEESETIPNTVERVLRSTLLSAHACDIHYDDRSDLLSIITDMLYDGVAKPIGKIPADELLEELYTKLLGWDFGDMEEFVTHPIITGEYWEL